MSGERAGWRQTKFYGATVLTATLGSVLMFAAGARGGWMALAGWVIFLGGRITERFA